MFATRTLATFAQIKWALLFERRRPCRYNPGPATLKKAVTNHLTRSFRATGDQDSLAGEFSCCRKRMMTTRSFSPLYKRIDWTPVSRTRRRRSELSTKHGSYASSQELNRVVTSSDAEPPRHPFGTLSEKDRQGPRSRKASSPRPLRRLRSAVPRINRSALAWPVLIESATLPLSVRRRKSWP